MRYKTSMISLIKNLLKAIKHVSMFLLSTVSMSAVFPKQICVFRFTKVMFNVYTSTNFTVMLFSRISLSHQRCQNQVGFGNYQSYICMSSTLRDLVTTKNQLKNIYKSECREGEIDTTLIQFR